MAIGDVYVGAFLAALYEKLASPDVREFARRLKILPHLQKLESRLWTTQQLLDDAENKQTKDEAVNTWLRDLRDWAYDADDLLDELATKSKLKTAADVVYTNMATSSSIAGFISKEVRALSSYMDVILYGYGYEAASKIDEIRARLESFYARKARLGLEVGVSNTGETWQRTPVASLGFHPNIYGRADVEQRIINLLLGIGTGQRRPGANKLDVVAIVGMGGIGKTTLARHVFNNPSVEKHFELKGWVSVSSTQFDVARATKAILEELKVDMGEVAQLGLNGLQTKLKDKLVEEEKKKKKFLLVLDDVWFTSYDDWDCLRSPFFLAAAPGSKVIVTTRHEVVASVMCAVERFTLEGLSDADCLSVFQQHAFENDPSTSYPNVEPFRPKILKICKGLPLAARVLGASLRGKQPNHWEATLNSDLWGLLEAEDGILSSLWLSYLHLPSHLKRCFSYCSVLPKNYEFEEEELVLLWMAEGLIGYQTGVDMEDLGRQYFRELLSRSLFQYASHHESRFVMHDHIHYLSRFVAGKSYVNLEDGLKVDSSFENVRHLSYDASLCSGNLISQKCGNMKSLRAVLQFAKSYGKSGSIWLNLLPKLRFLRALCLPFSDVTELPKEIGELIHLRYIDLSHTWIERLPESTCVIFNLQTLKLKGCRRLKTLPADTRKLTNLRHLDLSLCVSLQSMPVGLDKLTCLRTISISVPEWTGNAIRVVANLVHLGNSLRRLEFKWTAKSDPQDSSIALGALVLRSNQSLEILNIHSFPALSFPEWIELSNVRLLTLEEFGVCTILPPLGKLPNLETLKIIRFPRLEAVREEFYGGGDPIAFPKLKSLRFEEMRKWKEWWIPSATGVFPQLSELYIRKCEELVFNLPTQLLSLSKLHIERCKKVLIRNAMELKSLVSADALETGGVAALECFFTDNDCGDGGDATTQLLSWLSELEIRSVDLSELVYGALRADKHVWAHNVLHSLTSFTIHGIQQLSLLGAGAAGCILLGLSKLKQLKIEKCENLCGCVWTLDSSHAGSAPADVLLLPASLKKLEIYDCEKLEFVPVDSSSSLEFLSIKGCRPLSSLTSSDGSLPASLRELRIQNCNKLNFVVASWPVDSSLEVLVIRACSSLTRLTSTDMALPASLRELRIQDCLRLETVAASWPVGSSSLKELEISDCPSLTRLTSTDLPLRASLRLFSIEGCRKLQYWR